ncbi:ABC transport system, permease [Corynebacterium maris DSM 45190]|uniref:ABC transport system, permease n=1 Tax=Corynebacterium maris DSM 45190 TaxID=1224163 RepID=S5TJL6_9CORY|nr:energy-coupling factor transporter transmembrane protein EcfT [Corynebacterium maris]AGS35046.1 ABC transport system, permease [Corynebacterium maris DSM 45190]
MIRGLPMGVYVPGSTVLHRINPGIKFLGLIFFIILVAFFANDLPRATAALTVVVLGYGLARIPLRTAAGQVLPVLPVLLALGAFHWWQNDLASAAAMVIGLSASVAAAALLTLTTAIAELMDALEHGLRPLARLGVPVDTVSLAISLTIRLIPLLLHTVHEVLQARKARGAGGSLMAFGTPVVIRSITRARALGEALMARGVGD